MGLPAEAWAMITNRELTTDELFAEAVAEAIESARENGVSEADLVDILRTHADDLAVEGDQKREESDVSEPTEA